MTDDVYRQRILDHFRNPRNYGRLKGATHASVFVNTSCGDKLDFQVKISKGKIADVAFTGAGCAISMAAASLLSEQVKGKAAVSVKKIGLPQIQKLLQITISPARQSCALLGVETLKRLEKILTKVK